MTTRTAALERDCTAGLQTGCSAGLETRALTHPTRQFEFPKRSLKCQPPWNPRKASTPSY